LTALYVLAEDLRAAPAACKENPKITDAELVCLAVAQILLDCPSERRFLRFATSSLGHSLPAQAARLQQADAGAGATDRQAAERGRVLKPVVV
jgi:hypothetical protein